MSLDLSVLWVIFFVLLLVAVLNSLLFKPLMRAMHERERAISSARALAAKAAADAAVAGQQFEQRTRAARAEVHRELEETRRIAEAGRAELLAATREDVKTQLREATERLAEEAHTVRAGLAGDAEALGDAIVQRVLGRTPEARGRL